MAVAGAARRPAPRQLRRRPASARRGGQARQRSADNLDRQHSGTEWIAAGDTGVAHRLAGKQRQTPLVGVLRGGGVGAAASGAGVACTGGDVGGGVGWGAGAGATTDATTGSTAAAARRRRERPRGLEASEVVVGRGLIRGALGGGAEKQRPWYAVKGAAIHATPCEQKTPCAGALTTAPARTAGAIGGGLSGGSLRPAQRPPATGGQGLQ